METPNDVILTEAMLKVNYRKLVANRARKGYYHGTFSTKLVGEVAQKLKNPSFAVLFIEAQFSSMPYSFCMDKFSKPYPPASVVFGGRCFERYDNYKKRGIRDGA